jgi:hypothetical protein
LGEVFEEGRIESAHAVRQEFEEFVAFDDVSGAKTFEVWVCGVRCFEVGFGESVEEVVDVLVLVLGGNQ